jgi:DNA-binding IclR family transcriptional regulator
MGATPPADGDLARTLAKGLDLLRAFRPGEQSLGNKDFVERTGLPKPTVSRITSTLVQLGYLRYSTQLGRYSLGIALLSLAYPMLAGLGIRHIARPFMKELADAVGGQVSLGMRDRANIVYIECSRSPRHTLTVPEIGAAIPILSSAIGRAYIAALQRGQRDRVLDELRTADSAGWMRYSDRALGAADEFRDYGFTRSFGEIRPEMRSCAVPLRMVQEDELLVMNCGVPTYQLKRGQLEREIGPQLVATARSIEAACGMQWQYAPSRRHG